MREEVRVLFYTSISRSFRSSLIGNLYEIASQFPVTLVAEKLDSNIKNILKNKQLFPRLENIIPVSQYPDNRLGVFRKNWELRKLARKMVREINPQVVITANDMYPFEMYLLREAKKAGAINICIQAALSEDPKKISLWIDLINEYSKLPNFIPLFIRRMIVKLRKYIGHAIYYWLLPTLAGEKPFFGESSFVLHSGVSGMRDAHYQFVYSERDYKIHLRAGVPEKKLVILPHPLSRKSKEIFLTLNSSIRTSVAKYKQGIFVALPSDIDIGFRRDNKSLISFEERIQTWVHLFEIIRSNLPQCNIYTSLHPGTKNPYAIKDVLNVRVPFLNILNVNQQLESIVASSIAIIGFPPSASTFLYILSLLYPNKCVISLDPLSEMRGDYFKDFDNIKYISSMNDFKLFVANINNCGPRNNSVIMSHSHTTLDTIANIMNQNAK